MTTIAQWNKVDMPLEIRGVWTTIEKTSQLGPFLEFESIDGTSADFEREATLPVASFMADEGTITESGLTFAEKSESLKTIYTQSPLNNKKKQTARKQDPEAILKAKMSKAFRRKLEDNVINGQVSGNTDEFKGLLKWCIDDSRIMAMDDGSVGATGGSAETELTLARMDEFIDMQEGEEWDALIMNKTMRRKLTALARASGSGVKIGEVERFGRKVMAYDDIPIVLVDWISNAEDYGNSGTWPSSSATTIFATKFGPEKEGFTLFHNGGFMDLEFEKLATPRDENVTPWRLIGYPGSVVYSPLSIAALGGIDSAA